jgi:sulfoxide reductase catalytic subunit YedY
MLVRVKRGWEIPESEATPEEVYCNRRRFLRTAGALGLGLLGCQNLRGEGKGPDPAKGLEKKIYPARRNLKYTLPRCTQAEKNLRDEDLLTAEKNVTHYNNFYEFSGRKERVALLAKKLEPSPWKVEVTGRVSKPRTFDVDDLLRRMPLEERLYRFRCVEAWAMAVPWTGFPLAQLLDLVEPLSSAKYVRFVTFENAAWGPGFAETGYPWPYHEGLTMAEARNELTLLVTGLYGKPLPNQNGAPIRLITPWKYGFKSIKSIVRIELLEKKPPTFWNTISPREYGFLANVDPKVPHPRWSQATERMIDTGERRPTLPYNGYAESVATLYE